MMEQYVIYFNTKDYPGKWVMRKWTIETGSLIPVPRDAYICNSYEDCLLFIPSDRVKIMPSPGDDPVIKETWI